MPELVTIGIPIYKRLEYLPQILKIVEAQDYPSIELLVSDNGQNGDKIREILDANYSRPCTFRANPSTVSPATHFNQIVHAASGKYFVLLMDDDEISSNYVSELVNQFEHFPKCIDCICCTREYGRDRCRYQDIEKVPAQVADGAEFHPVNVGSL